MLCLFLLLLSAVAMFAQPVPCSRSAELAAAIQRFDPTGLGYEQANAGRRAHAENVVKEFPNDFLAHWYAVGDFKRPTQKDRTAAIARYEQYAAGNPGPNGKALLARALVDEDTPRAIALFEEAASANPWALLGLSDIYAFGKFQDRVKARDHLAAFFAACPQTTASDALSRIGSMATAELAKRVLPPLRELAGSRDDESVIPVWRAVWNLEFKARPVPEHATLRKNILAELVRLEAHSKGEEWLALLLDGYQQVGDADGEKRVGDRLTREFPRSNHAGGILDSRWRKDHPYPQPGDSDEQSAAYHRAALTHSAEVLAVRPDDFSARFARCNAYRELSDSDPTEMLKACDAVLDLIRRGIVGVSPPFQFAVARTLMKRKHELERVPRLIAEGALKSPMMIRTPSDRASDEERQMQADSERYLQAAHAEVLVEYAELKGEAQLARAAVEEADRRKVDKPNSKLQVLTMQARLAEIDKRKLDALLLYRAVLDMRPKNGPKPKEDKVTAAYDRLLLELGGSELARELLAAQPKPKAESSTDGRWEQPKKPMTSWQLTDLQGKSWRVQQFEGRMLLINVWATWCGPCRTEHPHFQKLYEKLKDRPDIQVLSFNIDESVGMVEPYMREGKYTFPVLLAKDYVEGLLPLVSIPRNWVVDGNGQWRWEQIGFGSPEGWEAEMIGKLEAAKLQ